MEGEARTFARKKLAAVIHKQTSYIIGKGPPNVNAYANLSMNRGGVKNPQNPAIVVYEWPLRKKFTSKKVID